MACRERKNRVPGDTQMLCLAVLVLFLLSIPLAGAQPSPPPDGYPYAKFSPSMAIIIVILVVALFFMGFFSIYIRRCSNDGGSVRAALSMRRVGRTTPASRGLDAAVIETFPTFPYSSVKEQKIGKGTLECAVCLNEFEDDETLRLIPKCDHVFHPECIDAWLESHVTCPVCRANLVPQPGESTHFPADLEVEEAGDGGNQTTAAGEQALEVSIPIGDDENAVNTQEPGLNRDKSLKLNRPPRSRSVHVGVPRLFEKFRSHSTGHSLVQPGENVDRYTLRLPEEVRTQLMNRAQFNRMGSTVRMTGEGSARKGFRTGEGSSRGKSYRRLESLDRVVVRSERWVLSRAPSFLTRAFSVRSPKVVSDNGEASTSSTTPKGSKKIDKIPLNNMGPKSDDRSPV